MSDLDWHGFCQKQGGRLQVSNDGENWANYTGPASGVEAYRYARCVMNLERLDEDDHHPRVPAGANASRT
jgi:hypothetical protein